MTVIKRNGSEVTFDITKIIAAITKANESVDESIRMTPCRSSGSRKAWSSPA